VILKDVSDVRQGMLDDCAANSQVEAFITCPQVDNGVLMVLAMPQTINLTINIMCRKYQFNLFS